MTKTLCYALSAALLVLTVSFGLSSQQVTTQEQVTDENMIKIGNFYMDKYEYPNKIGELPVTNVTWQEARAMCEAEGKRLCTDQEWVQACRGPQGLRYPYGPTYDGTKCNSESPFDGPTRIGENPKTCVSGYGVYDLNGSVWEWVGTSLEDGVKVRGGAWSSESCAECALELWVNSPNTSSDRGGFRCCK
jgi:formylglycine-generating enzyme required for sulfatase activity